jgi:pyruvate dehydrogenase E2 component (dihydrolipoamide acetyltransferase)
MTQHDLPEGRATLHPLGGAEGPPDLLLIHGFGSDRYSWSATAPFFFEKYRVWAVELPGHTGAPIDPGAGDAQSMARAVATAVSGRLQGPVPVVGHSLGGAVAVELANQFPDLVSSIVVIAPAGAGTGTNKKFLREFPTLSSPEEAQSLLELLVSRPKLISPQMVQHVLGFLGQPGRREALTKIAEELAAMRPLIFPAAVPISAVWGDSDVINPYADVAAGSPLTNAHVLQGVGHLPHVEQARKTNAVIADHISTA